MYFRFKKVFFYQSICKVGKNYKEKININKDKLNNYTLKGSIHTFSIKIPGQIGDVPELLDDCISSNISIDGQITTSIINLNKIEGDIFKFTDFIEKMKILSELLNISQYKFIRVDMRFDNYDNQHYREFAKLNRYLISMLAVAYKIKNAYRTENLFNQSKLSVAIKNDYFELENYDRGAKSALTGNHCEPAQARLEERTASRQWRKIYKNADIKDTNMDLLKKEFTENWFYRWDKAIELLDIVHERYNNELERIYKSDKDVSPKRFRSLTDFLIMYQDCIFTKAQLIDLLSRFEEVKNPKDKS